MRGQEGLSQHIVDPGTLEAAIDTPIRHLPDHLQLHQFSPATTNR